jgi:hypothetical protein
MSDSTQQPLPDWMVRNGETWTLVSFADRLQNHPEVQYLHVSRWEENPRANDTLLVLGVREFRKVVPEGSGGWTSIACGSESDGWVNLVVEDGLGLARALEHAVYSTRQRRDELDINHIMNSRVLSGESGPTNGELLIGAASIHPLASRSDAIAALEATTMLWEMVFQEFQLDKIQERDELSMLMYGDEGRTMLLLEDGRYLPGKSSYRDLDRDDLRLASALKRLRGMTTWASRGFDIDKRCHSAISAHAQLRPLLDSYYGRTLAE